MVNLNTPSSELFSELKEEYGKALYWLKKQWGGTKGYERMRDDLLSEAIRTQKPQSSKVVEYNSPKGNRWKIFEQAWYFKESLGSHCMPMAFVYYETYGSVGAFLVSVDSNAVTIYTSHFFYQMCQRLDIPMRSSRMIEAFIKLVPMQFVQEQGIDPKDGLMHADVYLFASIGRGIIRKKDSDADPTVIEVRTFLTEAQLSNKQKRMTEHLRKVGKAVKYEPEDMRRGRLALSFAKNGAKATIESELDKCEMIGLPRKDIEKGMDYILCIAMALKGVGHNLTAEQTEKMGRSIFKEVYESVYNVIYGSDYNDFFELLFLGELAAERNGIKIDKNAFAHSMARICYEKEYDKDLVDKWMTYIPWYKEMEHKPIKNARYDKK